MKISPYTHTPIIQSRWWRYKNKNHKKNACKAKIMIINNSNDNDQQQQQWSVFFKKKKTWILNEIKTSFINSNLNSTFDVITDFFSFLHHTMSVCQDQIKSNQVKSSQISIESNRKEILNEWMWIIKKEMRKKNIHQFFFAST